MSGGEEDTAGAEETLAAEMCSLAVGDTSEPCPRDAPAPSPAVGPALPDRQEKVKIDILLKATGNAPIMKKKKWAVDAEKPVGWIMEFVKKYLKLEPEEKLFLYVNQTFAPSPDQVVRNLYECFGTDGKLVLHYCKSQAWG